MIVRTIEILLEYISIILCIHKISDVKIKINKWNIGLFCIDYIAMMGVSYGILSPFCRCIVYGLIVIYIKIATDKEWNKSISIFGSVMMIMISLQFIIFYFLKILHFDFVVVEPGSLINLVICVLVCTWKQQYFYAIVKYINSVKGIIISMLYVLIFVQIIYLGECEGHIRKEMIIQFLAESMGLTVVTILWVGAEIRNKQRIRELKMYEMYNQAYEETILTIRTRQHEFENHLNTIKCLQYTIKDREELYEAQKEYCDKVLQDTSMNQLLRLCMEPALVGFLYSKITAANEKGISVKYDIQPIKMDNQILVYEIIEIIGILFDNAVEALEKVENKILVLKIKEGEGYFFFEVANRSHAYQNQEIEKFVEYGYSTKGENRGIGLARVKEIAKKHKAEFEIGNYMYDNENYLRFRIKFEK